uniref:Uncharacterized protein n=1 Tax=Cuerna arida TaxID=1464854 RepID=A0A1B6ENC0_9HEMI
MTTLAASAYFLTCCRPTFGSSFCFYVETPKLINLYHYPNNYLFGRLYSQCNDHPSLKDHCLNQFNSCTDGRGWCQDAQQQRLHFLDAICGRISLCGYTTCSCRGQIPAGKKEADSDNDKINKEKSKKPKEEIPKHSNDETKTKNAAKREKADKVVTSGPTSAEVQPPPAASPSSPVVAPTPAPSAPPQAPPTPPTSPQTTTKSPTPSQEPQEATLTPPPTPSSSQPHSTPQVPPTPSHTPKEPQEVPVNGGSSCDDVVELTDQIVDKLDDSLDHLESSFVNYVEKNKKIIHNLADMLAFEKHKQRALEDSYKGLKQENDILRTKMDYLKLVNFKQLELFRNELDKGISENKAVYKNKIRQLEVQVQQDNDELQSYKQTEKKYLEILENNSLEIAKLADEVKNRQYRESELLNNYVKILNFLNVLKEKLTNSSERKEVFQEPSDTITDCEKEPKLNEVLKQALNRGMNSLNVRDLSIIHDAIQDINEDLCHVGCGRNQVTTQVSISHITTVYGDQDDEYQSGITAYKEYQDYDTPSNLSMYPTRLRPGNHLHSGYC